MTAATIIVGSEFFETWATDGTLEGRSFRTYLNYLRALDIDIRHRYGEGSDLYSRLAEVMQHQTSYRQIRSRTCDRRAIEKALRSAWATEVVILQSVVSRRQEVVAGANLWSTVQSYYAVYHAAQAFFEASGWWSPPNTHSGTLKLLSEVALKRQYLPPPWDAWCDGPMRGLAYGGLAAAASASTPNSLSAPYADCCPEWVAMILRTTRERKIKEAKEQWIRVNKKSDGSRYQIVPSNRQESVLKNVAPTTLFDFLYRLRVRSNYKDADAFVLSDEATKDAVEFSTALTTVLQGTLFVLEVGIVKSVGKAWFDEVAQGFRTAVGPASRQALGSRVTFH